MTVGTTATVARCWWGGRYEIHWWTEEYAGEEATMLGTLRDFLTLGHQTEILKVVHRLPTETDHQFSIRAGKYTHLLEGEQTP